MKTEIKIFVFKLHDKSTTSYAMLDFESDIRKFVREISGNWTPYITNPRHTFVVFKV